MKPTILILVGITGDLAKRKLLPAIDSLKDKGLLPAQFKLVGVTRGDDPELFKMDLDDPADYQRLKEHLEHIEKEWGSSAQRLFYLSVAPTVSMPIIKQLGESGLASVPDTKLLLEKPFGRDQEDAVVLVTDIAKYFSDDQVYRVDHYLQKDCVRALSSRRMAESALERIDVIASESIGIEGRGHFYEQTGALRDFVQSHLLEVAAMTVSPQDRLAALKHFFIPNPITDYVKRAQYIGYREAVQNPDSAVETMVSIVLQAKNDLTITLKTGKALDQKTTDIHIFYKDKASEVISLHNGSNAYEHVFLDAMQGKKEFFVSKEEVLETWRILAPVQKAWQNSNEDLMFYEQGNAL